MKIAILTSGILPVPAVQGGAVETLTDFYLAYNQQHALHDITVYSIHPKLSLWTRMKRKWFAWTHEGGYYHPTIEYFLHEALKDIRKKHYDIIILENRPGYALKLKEVTDAQLVYHLHNDILNNKSPQAQELYDAAWRIITVSDYIKGRVKTLKADDTKCITVHNGIDLQQFNSNNMSNRSQFGLQADDFVLIFSGRINQEKGIMQLVEAMIRLQMATNIKLLVLGSSFYGNATTSDAFIVSLKAKAEQLKDRIIFTGFVPYSEMPRYLHIADVAIIPSVWDDPFPTTVLEAQAMGLPIITTRRGGIPEEVTEKNAILLKTDEHFVDNLAAAILDLYEHPEKRQQMSEASLQRAKLFDEETYARNFFKALEP